MDLQQLYQDKGELHKQMTDLMDKAIGEERDFTAEEEQQYAQMEQDYTDLNAKIKETEESEERRRKRLEDADKREQELKAKKDKKTKTTQTATEDAEEAYQRAINQYLIWGDKAVSMVPQEEWRALQADIDKSGGYLVMPERFSTQLIQDMDNIVFVRRYATVTTLTEAASFAAPELEDDPDDADWTAEIKTGTEDSTTDFAKRVFMPRPSAKRIKVSKTLLRIAALPVDSIVRERLAYKFGVTEEKAFIGGDGNNKPLGVYTASAQGISTGRDTTASSTTAFKADDIVDMHYSIKQQYRRAGLRWCVHRDFVKRARKLKTGDGQYMFIPGLRQGEADTLYGSPIDESEYAESTFTTGLYVAVLGNWSKYWIVQMLNFNIQVLTELYAETNQVGYIGRMEVDGGPIDENAFGRLKMA